MTEQRLRPSARLNRRQLYERTFRMTTNFFMGEKRKKEKSLWENLNLARQTRSDTSEQEFYMKLLPVPKSLGNFDFLSMAIANFTISDRTFRIMCLKK